MPIPHKTMLLKKGTVSKEVAEWQTFLAMPADGIFGENTEKATKLFQKSNGLKADGVVGPATLRKAGLEKFIQPTDYYPPRPKFSSPSSSTRSKLFGKFEWKKLNKTDIKIEGNWTAENIVKVKITQLIGVEGAPKSGEIFFHKAGAEQIKGFFAEVERQGLLPLVISWAGSFYPRFIRGSSRSLSNHSWGTAFDINAPQNWLGQRPAAVGKTGSLLKLVPIANSFGFYWGGHYNSRLDGMHFELAVLDMFPDKYNEIVSDEEEQTDQPETPDIPTENNVAAVQNEDAPADFEEEEAKEENSIFDTFSKYGQKVKETVDQNQSVIDKVSQVSGSSQTITLATKILGWSLMVWAVVKENWIEIAVAGAIIGFAIWYYKHSKDRQTERTVAMLKQ